MSWGFAEAERNGAKAKPRDAAKKGYTSPFTIYPEKRCTPIVNKDVARTASETQEAFWKMADPFARQQVTGFLEQALLIVQPQQLSTAPRKLGAQFCGWHGLLATPCSLRTARVDEQPVPPGLGDFRPFLLGRCTRARLAEQIFGASLSHQTVSVLMRWLADQLAAWRARPIAPVYPVVYMDGMHVDVLGGDRMVRVVMGMRADGGKEVLDFCLRGGEQCTQMLWDLCRRTRRLRPTRPKGSAYPTCTTVLTVSGAAWGLHDPAVAVMMRRCGGGDAFAAGIGRRAADGWPREDRTPLARSLVHEHSGNRVCGSG